MTPSPRTSRLRFVLILAAAAMTMNSSASRRVMADRLKTFFLHSAQNRTRSVPSIRSQSAAQGDAILARSGVPTDDRHIARQADVRYVGQGHEIRIDLPDGQLGPNNLAALRQTFAA